MLQGRDGGTRNRVVPAGGEEEGQRLGEEDLLDRLVDQPQPAAHLLRIHHVHERALADGGLVRPLSRKVAVALAGPRAGPLGKVVRGDGRQPLPVGLDRIVVGVRP